MSKFSWSYSKLRDWENCPRAYEYKHIQKHKEIERPEQLYGQHVHKVLEDRALRGTPLPPEMEKYEKYGAVVDHARRLGYQIVGEQQWAIDNNFMPCGWREWNVAWCRVILDLGIIGKRSALFLDYKTGRKRPDPTQLALFAAVGFEELPKLDVIKTQFVWTEGGAPDEATYHRNDKQGIWAGILPRVMKMQRGIEAKAFQPTPNGLCKKHCSVFTCEHNGRRSAQDTGR